MRPVNSQIQQPTAAFRFPHRLAFLGGYAYLCNPRLKMLDPGGVPGQARFPTFAEGLSSALKMALN